MVASFDNIKKYIQMREKNDPHMPNFLVVLYFLPVFVGIVAVGYVMVSFMAQFSSVEFVTEYDFIYDEISSDFKWPLLVVGLSGFTSIFVGLIISYFLVNRRKTHFNRHKLLCENLIVGIDSFAQTKEGDIQDSLLSLRKNVEETNTDRTDKNPILWAFLSSFIPFLALYVCYFLMSDFYKHEQSENSFWQQFSSALNQLGINFSVPQRTEHIPNRSFVLYLILTILTMGLFGTYWLYVLLKDPNQHFDYHKRVENQLLTAIDSNELQ